MAAGRAGEPLAPAHVKKRLSAGLLGAEALPELDLAQALDRAPQSFCRCHPWSPPPPKAAETLAPPGMRVMGNQETKWLSYSTATQNRRQFTPHLDLQAPVLRH